MGGAWVRRACEIQLYALVFALPFEYHFGSRDQSLYTSLKAQLILLAATWAYKTLAGFPRSRWETYERMKRIIPGRMALAAALLVGIQSLAAALAPEYQANAINAAVKSGIGVLFAFIVADLLGGPRAPFTDENQATLGVLRSLSLSGTCMSILGLGALAGSRFLARVVYIFQPSGYFLGDRVRFSSTMEYPTTAGSFLSVSLCASFVLAALPAASRRPQWKWLWSAAAAIQTLALTLTYSRGALIATVIAISAVAWVLRSRFFGSRGKLTLTIVLAVLSTGMTAQFLTRHEPGTRGYSPTKRIARYGLDGDAEVRFLRPNRAYRQIIEVRNDASFAWRQREYGIAYRWSRLSDDKNLPPIPGTGFRDDLAPGQSIEVPVSLVTPVQEGEYLLIWYVFGCGDGIREVKDSYAPAILCFIEPVGESMIRGMSGKARYYLRAIRKERQDLHDWTAPGRAELWTAALRILRRHPLLGAGPDNFRLVKWGFMDTPKGDETILANSLYLEILSGSGVLGLVSFLWLVWEWGRLIVSSLPSLRYRSSGAACCFGIAYITGLLTHGFVDYFLKFTPTFLLFWLALGVALAGTLGSRLDHDADRV